MAHMSTMNRGLVLVLVAISACMSPAERDAATQARTGVPMMEVLDDAERRQFVIMEISDQNAHLLASDRAEKLAKMATDAFSFFRGSAHLYWSDMGPSPLLATYGGADAVVWLQGDLHVNNYGVFDNDDGHTVYDLNDFDEAFIGDYQLDVWRLAISVVLIGRSNGLDETEIEAAVDSLSESYLDALDAFRKNDDEADAMVDSGNAYGRLDELLRDVEEQQSRQDMLERWTTVTSGTRVLDLDHEDLTSASPNDMLAISDAWVSYRSTLSGGLDDDRYDFSIKSIARRLHAGIGSLGTPRFYVLIEGPSDDIDDDVILDVKRQTLPVGLSEVDEATQAQHATWFSNPAVLAVRAQKALGTDVDDHLGWFTLSDGAYSVRARSPFKASFPSEELDSLTRLQKLSEQWGAILAANHARADKDHNEQWVPYDFEDQVHTRTDGEHAEFRALVRDVAFTYATQVAIDYGFFLEHYANE